MYGLALTRRRRAHRTRWPRAVIAWLGAGGILVGLTVTPGVRHGGGEPSPQVVTDTGTDVSTTDEAEPSEGVVVFRRHRPRRVAHGVGAASAVAHHGGATERGEAFVHTHDGRNPHVHYSILGFEFVVPASSVSGDDEELLATNSSSTEVAEHEQPRFPTLTSAPLRTTGDDFGGTTSYLAPPRVVLPDALQRERLRNRLVLPASPLLAEDAPVPRPPRV